MYYLRRSQDRGHANFGWLDTHHTFSFGHYYDPVHMGFGSLRVINDDRVAPGAGFGEHGHRDMEILSFVLSGKLEHRDSMGNGSVIEPGDVQRMSAGTGIRHSEFNGSDHEEVNFLQIWLLPETNGLEPGYEQRHFTPASRRDQLKLLASPDGQDGSLTIHQQVRLFGSDLSPGRRVDYDLNDNRKAWVHVYRGAVRANAQELGPGDGLGISDVRDLSLEATEESAFLLFDMAA